MPLALTSDAASTALYCAISRYNALIIMIETIADKKRTTTKEFVIENQWTLSSFEFD